MCKYFLIIVVFLSSVVQAQGDKTVTLTVTGQGQTQDEAKQSALRSAIEQAFGTFISSKTEILNDKLVLDKIVSVANGNIQNFEVISEVQIPDVGYATTLKATVSVTKLTSFVESKGVVAEFKGNILAANIKQQMLNEQNENKAISNIASICKKILDLSCDFEIVRGEPKQKNNDNNKWAVPLTINVKFNKNIENFNKYFLNSLRGLSMSPEEVIQYQQLGKQTYKIALGGGSDNGNEFSYKQILTGTGKEFGEEQIDHLEKVLDSIKLYNDRDSSMNLIFQLIGQNGLPNGDILYEINSSLYSEIPESEMLRKKIRKLFRNKLNPYPFWYGPPYLKCFDKKILKPDRYIYHFRSLTTVISIIDLIYYNKNSILNFKIENGIDTITPKKLIADAEFSKRWDGNKYVYNKVYGCKVISDNLTPVLVGNKICGIFADFTAPWSASKISLYSPIEGWNKRLYYNGSNPRIFMKDNEIFEKLGYSATRGSYNLYNSLKYNFLTVADNDLSAIEKYEDGFQAVISLFDFTVNNNIIKLYFEDILSLNDMEKVKEYKILNKYQK